MARHSFPLRISITLMLIVITGIPVSGVKAADVDEDSSKHFTYEFYYKVKWGYFGEWMDLYKKNHFPVLQRLQELGRIESMEATFPIDHAGEADRWDLRFTIVYPSVEIAYANFDRSTILDQLYPDREAFEKEEKRRFELLLEHRDVAVHVDDLSDW